MPAPILENTGLTLRSFHIPAFKVNAGDFVVIYLCNGAPYEKLRTEAGDALSGKHTHGAIRVNAPFQDVLFFRESSLWKHLFPSRIGTYLQNTIGLDKVHMKQLCQDLCINSRKPMKLLDQVTRKKLLLAAAFTKTNHIVFDLWGVGYEDAQTVLKFVKEHIAEHGSTVILLDNCPDLRNECTTFVEAILQNPG